MLKRVPIRNLMPKVRIRRLIVPKKMLVNKRVVQKKQIKRNQKQVIQARMGTRKRNLVEMTPETSLVAWPRQMLKLRLMLSLMLKSREKLMLSHPVMKRNQRRLGTVIT